MSKEQISRNRYWNFRQLIKSAGGNNGPVGTIDRAGANEIADRMTIQASKLRRFSLSG